MQHMEPEREDFGQQPMLHKCWIPEVDKLPVNEIVKL